VGKQSPDATRARPFAQCRKTGRKDRVGGLYAFLRCRAAQKKLARYRKELLAETSPSTNDYFQAMRMRTPLCRGADAVGSVSIDAFFQAASSTIEIPWKIIDL
jgi:hypothetical protein